MASICKLLINIVSVNKPKIADIAHSFVCIGLNQKKVQWEVQGFETFLAWATDPTGGERGPKPIRSMKWNMVSAYRPRLTATLSNEVGRSEG